MKTEATCAPVAPPPITSIDGGTEVRLQASLWVFVNSNPGTSSRRLTPPVQMMNFSACSRRPVAGFDRVRVDEARNAGVFVHGHAQRIDLLAPGGMRTHVLDDLADARKQPRIIQHRLAHRMPYCPSCRASRISRAA